MNLNNLNFSRRCQLSYETLFDGKNGEGLDYISQNGQIASLKIITNSIHPPFLCYVDPIWTLDETSFDMALSMGQNVLVDFYAPWCKACVIFAPKYQNAVQEAVKNGLDVTFAKVDTDQNPYLTQRFGVNTFPRLLLFPRSGARPKRYTMFFNDDEYEKKSTIQFCFPGSLNIHRN